MKKGFTLVELLATIVLLGLLITIAVPAISSVIKNNKEKLYESQINEIERLSKQYLIDNPNVYTDIDTNGYVEIPLNEFVSKGYFDCPILDPRDNSNINGHIKISVENDDYIYEYVQNDEEISCQ